MSMFGGLSRAERNRLRVRVRTAMKAMAPEGRYLGGRPPYGYRLERTGVPHPNPEKARQGVELTNLSVDPETSKVVEQIFAWRVEGIGFRTIATRLTERGLPCPSAADRERNPHRHGRAWSVGAVRTIVMNPKYKGQGSYGRYRKVERLYDVNDPAAGNVTRMSLSPAAEVIETDGIVPAIVSETVWARRKLIGPRLSLAHVQIVPNHLPTPSEGSLSVAGAANGCRDTRSGGQAVRNVWVTNAFTGPNTQATKITPDHYFWPRTGFCRLSMLGWRS
jgi:hypothetical protein